MKYELTIIEKTKDGEGNWQLEEYAIELYENWEEVLRAISILIPKGYLYELKIIHELKIIPLIKNISEWNLLEEGTKLCQSFQFFDFLADLEMRGEHYYIEIFDSGDLTKGKDDNIVERFFKEWRVSDSDVLHAAMAE